METEFAIDKWSGLTHKFEHGFVKFDLKDVSVPGLGKFHVRSEFPRLKPKYERDYIDDVVLEELCSSLMPWVNENFETTGREEYFKGVVLVSVLTVVYTVPLSEFYSEGFDISFKWTLWLYVCDDAIDKAIESKIHCGELKKVTDQYMSVAKGDYDFTQPFENVQGYPIFGKFFDSLVQVYYSWKKYLPNYGVQVKKISKCIQEYYDALVWFCADEIDGRYSIETFRGYRRANSLGVGIAQIPALIYGVQLPDHISNNVAIARLEDLFNSIITFTNDLLGMKKEFSNGEKDNLIVFMVLQKKIPIDVAVRQVCEMTAVAMIDYDLLKKVILKKFDYDDTLVKYLDIFDTTIDGHYQLYTERSRYRTSPGSVSLTR